MNQSAILRLTLLGLVLLLVPGLTAQTIDLDLFKAMTPRHIGPAGMSGRVTSIDAVTANPDIIYIGTASGGLWKSESGGIDWTPIFDEQPTASIGAVAIYQKNPDIIWVGTGEGNPRNSQSSGAGVFRSLDGGKTWTYMGLKETRNIHRVIIHPDNPNVVYVGAQGVAWGESEHRGLYKTTDGGQTWEKILYANETTGIADLVMDPANPNKLFAAMWQFRRWPWYFQSGGEGSGLFVSFDGGDTWQERTEADGLPKGELGRMGLAVAASNPKVVYALIESKKNALYRSDDGGFTFRKINENESIGNRPFYYADLYVDPKNENRLYSIHSTVTWSEDGGKSFQTLLAYGGDGAVHPDHHAWYIHPDNNRLLMNGNDGGMAISRDMGDNWRFIENLPLAQYYHINYDMDMPYHVYGGMQDNGSWQGPAYVWRAGGIRNAYWTELFFGDGFDVVPDPDNNRYGYAMSQGGNLGYYDIETGESRALQPRHPEGVELRFNWNAGIAQDPFDPSTIYYGSQFVHLSRDKGLTWEIISPDLTTNDTSKQKQLQSGGLTYDVTDAENYTSILAISPSPVDEQLIWVGTDDGNLQLTRDDGATWTNLIDKLPGAPQGAWIPVIHASEHAAGEAFVVINDYRRNNWKPYLYHTDDYGQSWTRLVEDGDVTGHCLSVVQDPEAENLVFLGTETGLYVSIDQGQNWTRWEEGYPTAPTQDLKIHPREGDLIIGTFGRSAWVIDDIRPLRALAKQGTDMLEEELVVFDPPQAVLAGYGQAAGTRFAADAIYSGDNRRGGARISVYLNRPEDASAGSAPDASTDSGSEEMTTDAEADAQPKVSYDSLKLEILDDGRVIRTLYAKADTGLNILRWGLRQKGVRRPGSQKPKDPREEPGGRSVLPGIYTARVSYGTSVDSTEIEVLHDPRVEMNLANLQANAALMDEGMQYMGLATAAVDQLREAEKSLQQISELLAMQEGEQHQELKEQTQALQDSVTHMLQAFLGDDTKQGIYRDPSVITSKLWPLYSFLDVESGRPYETQQLVLKDFKQAVLGGVGEVNTFFETDWEPYVEAVKAAKLSPFKVFEPIGLER